MKLSGQEQENVTLSSAGRYTPPLRQGLAVVVVGPDTLEVVTFDEMVEFVPSVVVVSLVESVVLTSHAVVGAVVVVVDVVVAEIQIMQI